MGYMDFTQHPAYQRMVQRMGRIRPEQRAIWRTLSVDPQFADENTRKMLASLSQQRDVDYANRSLDLREKNLTADMGLRRDAFDFEKNQDKMATGIGLGQVAAEAQYGGRRDAIELATLKKKLDFQNSLAARYGGV